MSQTNRLDEYDAQPTPKKSNTGLMIGGCIGCGCIGMIVLCIVVVVAAYRGCESLQGTFTDALQTGVCNNNLTQISAALDKYYEKYDSYPPAYTVDDDGNKLHSWRVLILPFLDDIDSEEQKHYENIKLDEPWNSEHNRQYHTEMPITFTCFQLQNFGNITQGHTSYKMVIGPGTLSEGSNSVTKDEITQNPFYITVIVEVVPNTNWMDPSEITVDEAVNGQMTGSHHKDGSYHIMRLDGTIEVMSKGEKLERKQFMIQATEDDEHDGHEH